MLLLDINPWNYFWRLWLTLHRLLQMIKENSILRYWIFPVYEANAVLGTLHLPTLTPHNVLMGTVSSYFTCKYNKERQIKEQWSGGARKASSLTSELVLDFPTMWHHCSAQKTLRLWGPWKASERGAQNDSEHIGFYWFHTYGHRYVCHITSLAHE